MPPGRTSNRLTGYDYAQPGAYFVTVCVKGRRYVLSTIEDGSIHLLDLGLPVELSLRAAHKYFSDVSIDAYAVMPNQIHAILIVHAVSTPRRGGVTPPQPQEHGLGTILAYLKYHATKAFNQYLNPPGQPIWQRNDFDQIVRNDHELDRLRRYKLGNPDRWEFDRYHMA